MITAAGSVDNGAFFFPSLNILMLEHVSLLIIKCFFLCVCDKLCVTKHNVFMFLENIFTLDNAVVIVTNNTCSFNCRLN